MPTTPRKDDENKEQNHKDPSNEEAIEEQSQDIGEEVKRIVEEESLHSEGTGYATPFQSCHQGHRARYAGLRCRQVVTVSGLRWLMRAYYYCAQCGGGWCPTDLALGLGQGQCSRRAQVLIARFSSYLPYRTVSQEMEAVCGIRLATRTIERYAQALGQRLGQEWERLEQVREAEDLPASDLPVSMRPSRLHVTMDGVMAHVGGDWHEVKLGCVYQTTANTKGSVGKAVRTRYMATLCPSVSFGKRLRVLAHQAGGDRCRDVAVVADGAEWIWQETGKHFPRSVQVVDFYHGAQHLWVYAHARFGEGTPAGTEWMRVQKEHLLSDGVAQVIAEVRAWPAEKAAEQELQRRLVGYLSKHQARMRYQTFRAAGYHIGSGVAESGCKNVVQQRMKGLGMRWSKEGAEAQLQLCAHWKSAGVKDFYAYTAPQTPH